MSELPATVTMSENHTVETKNTSMRLLDQRPTMEKVSDEMWSMIFASVDRREALKTLSLVNKRWMNLSRCMLFSTLDFDETGLLRVQHLYVEATVNRKQVMLPLSAVKTLRLHFSQISLDQFILLSTFLILSGARPLRLHIQGFICMEAHARLAIKRSSIIHTLRQRLGCVRELHLLSPRSCRQDGALWLWLCPHIDLLQGSAPVGPWQVADRLHPLTGQESVGLQGLFAAPSSREVPNSLTGYVCPAESLIVGPDEDEVFLTGLKSWVAHGMTLNVKHLYWKEVLCVPNHGCLYLQPLLMACSATLVELKIDHVADKGASLRFLPKHILIASQSNLIRGGLQSPTRMAE